MKLYNLLGEAILTIMLLCFFAIPQGVFAMDFNLFNFIGEDKYQVLSEFQSKRILQNFPDVLYNQWILSKSDGYSNPMETTTVSLLKHISTLSMWNYLFKDIPIEISFNVAKEGLDIVRLVGTEDASGMIGKIEKGTVNIAVNYLKDYFSKNEIKVSFGAMEMKYETNLGEVNSPLQYIIMYKKIDDKKSKVVARIYSPKEIIPPSSRGSVGAVKGFANSLKYGENITPFVVEINGIMDDGLFGSYFWDKNNTTIKTVFPETVPDFGLKPKTWQQKYITDPIKNTINSFSGIFNFFTGGKENLTEYILKESTDKEAINKEVESINSNNSLEKDYPVKEIKENIVEQKEIIKEVAKEDKKIEKEEEIENKTKEKAIPVICSKSSQQIFSYDVIINEIAWMGTENSANDEWIELKNISNSDINLKGWTLRDKEDQINIAFDDYTVPRGGFLLLERTDDNTIPFMAADLIYKGSLSNSDEELYLFDSQCQEKDFVSGSPKWPAGDSTDRKTMERDSDLIGWHTYSGSGGNGIWGTPKENNSVKKEEATAVTVASVSTSTKSPTVYGGGGLDIPASYCSQSNLSSATSNKIIINEIAWMGTENSANDEWIELKNISNEVVNLTGWQLLDGENIKVVFNSLDVINPQGFYLLERTDDDSVPNVLMNKVYTGALSNNNESLRIFDSNCQLMDEALANPDWLAGDNTARKTMERNNDLSGWHTYYSSSPDPISNLWGTPMAENSVEVNDNDDEDDDLIDNNHLLITEVETGGIEGVEYLELYNQTDNLIELCPSEENCYYLSYYSSSSSWHNPSHNWKFPEGAIINSNSYYIIDIYGNSGDAMLGTGADWKVKSIAGNDYESGQISNLAGSLSIFSNNPKYIENEENANLTDEEKTNISIGLKIDAVSWKSEEEGPIVKEGDSFDISESGKVIERKWSNQKYKDTNNNLNDFQLVNASLRGHSPKPPEKVQDLLAVVNEEQRNSVILTWTNSLDEDTASQDLTYDIYYSRNNQIDDSNLTNINDYVATDIVSTEGNKKRAILKDIFYDSNYYFKVRAKDPENNVSPLSEIAQFSISKANHQKRAPYYDFKRSGHGQFNGPVGLSLAYNVVIEGNQDNPPSNDFTSAPVIDENGTIYFWGSNNSSYDFYAFNSLGKKWSIHCSGACGVFPALGSDGTIYISSDNYIQAISPSGKSIWKKEYVSVLTKSIIIDSRENVYFLASKEATGYALISIDKNGAERELNNLQEILNGSNPSSFSELVIDSSDNVYFSINDYVLKYSNGTTTKKQFLPTYEETCPESFEVMASIRQVNISFDGNVLVGINNGRYIRENEVYPVLYAMDSNLSQTLWSKNDYLGPIGFNEEEFYYTRTEIGAYPMIYYLGAANISNGQMKWERRLSGVNFVVSDLSNRIYFTNNSGVIGYDSNNMPEDMGEKVFHVSPGAYYGDIVSIGDKKTYFSNLQRVYRLDVL